MLWDIAAEDLHLDETFIVKYEWDGTQGKKQRVLDDHVDGCEFSFVLGLNKITEYREGGTMFTIDGTRALQGEGDLLLFSGQNQHRGVEIVEGKRYILTGFVSLRNRGFCRSVVHEEIEKMVADQEKTEAREEQEARKKIEQDLQRQYDEKEAVARERNEL